MRKLKQIFITIVIIVCSLAQQIKIPLVKDCAIGDIESLIHRKDFQSSGHMIVGYSGYIEVGFDKKKYRVIFDTGSDQLWLPSPECEGYNKCEGLQNSYTCLKSDGCIQTRFPNKIIYMKGQVEGHFATVQLSLQGQKSFEQNILLVNKSKDFKYLKADGIFGLGLFDYGNLKLNGGNSYISTLKNNGIIDKNMFSFYLGFEDNDNELIIGGFNPDKLQNPSEIYYHKVIQSNFYSLNKRWGLEIKSFSFSDLQYNFPRYGNIGIVDSGSSFIILPVELFQKFTNFIRSKYDVLEKSKYDVLENSNEIITIKCPHIIDLPDLKFSLQDNEGVIREYSIPSSFYILKVDQICVVMVQSMKEEIKDVAVILGNVFMRRYVSIFTHTNSTVGLSLSIANPSDGESQYMQITLGLTLFIGIAGFLLNQNKQEQPSKNQILKILMLLLVKVFVLKEVILTKIKYFLVVRVLILEEVEHQHNKKSGNNDNQIVYLNIKMINQQQIKIL